MLRTPTLPPAVPGTRASRPSSCSSCSRCPELKAPLPLGPCRWYLNSAKQRVQGRASGAKGAGFQWVSLRQPQAAGRAASQLCEPLISANMI
jgi:hypothetical protein